MGNDCMPILTFQINLVSEKFAYLWHFLFIAVDCDKYTTQWPMGDSGNDAIYIRPHRMKTHCQNQLKIAVQVYFEILYRTRHKKTEVMMTSKLSNAPLSVYVVNKHLIQTCPYYLPTYDNKISLFHYLCHYHDDYNNMYI